MSSIGNHETAARLSHHPCFNQDARHQYARIHLPVAPRCNMQCNYCNRRYNCVNESRPGVTCAVLSPGQAIEYLRRYVEKNPQLSVVGIAGPGDPMACASETLETLRMVRTEFPHLLLCIASNGLNLPAYSSDLAAAGLSHVTVTVNAVDPAIGAKFYRWIEVDGKQIAGEEAAAELWQRQQQAIRELAAAGTIVKINTIYTPGINDGHIETIAQTVAVLGASILNIMPLLPTAGTAFAAFPEPDRATLQQARKRAGEYLPQMAHCARCRADAAGLVGEENMAQQKELLQIAARPVEESAANIAVDPSTGLPLTLSPQLRIATSAARPYVAVASRDGLFVNQHLGEAGQLRIYRPAEQRSHLVDLRSIDHEGEGAARWLKIVEKLQDCAAVLVSGAGAMPRKIFAHYGITVGIVEGAIDEALAAVARGGDLAWMAKPGFRCGDSDCSGERTGCE
jgi:nitrogen fixation protein NifB